MSRLQWSWAKVKTGQIIRFRYNGEMRVCAVLSSPRDTGASDKKMLHCLQLQTSGIGVTGMSTKMNEILRYSGGVILFREDATTGSRYFKLGIGTAQGDNVRSERLYTSIKHIVKSRDLYKTFSWNKCNESMVQLDNDELNEDNIPPKYLAKAGVNKRPDYEREQVKPKPKTFKRKPPKLKREYGSVWEANSGKFGAKNYDGVVRMFKDRSDAERFSKFSGTTGNYEIQNKRGKVVTVKPEN